jgi:hypothetical protein
MQNEHFTVDQNVCYTCHFKGAERGHSVTGCKVCHGSPKQIVEHQGFSFNHESYLKIGVDCSQCHLDVIKGDAEVEQKKCYSCHVERLSEFSNSAKIHSVHIKQHGVDCSECHNEIMHGKIRMVGPLETGCENCHQRQHTLQRQMYIGVDGRDVSDTPSRMFAAQVSCEGCHLDLNRDGRSDMSEKRQACVKCHGKDYDKMLDRWMVKVHEVTTTISGGLLYAKQVVKSGKETAEQKALLGDAEFNFDFVERGHGAHNVEYAVKLLTKVADNIDAIVQRSGNKGYRVPRTAMLTDDNAYCDLCHAFVPFEKTLTFAGQKFSHEKHTQFNKCTVCHSREVHKKLTITSEGCESCHSTIKQAAKLATFQGMEFSHDLHSKKLNLNCATCHSKDVFKKGTVENKACQSCHHQGKTLILDCKKCHVLQSEIYLGKFMSAASPQPDVMQAGGIECDACHVTKEQTVTSPGKEKCAECHDKAYEDMHVEWQSDVTKTISELSQLMNSLKTASLPPERKKVLQESEALASSIKKDGSKGIHNYQLLSDLLAKRKKELEGMKPN